MDRFDPFVKYADVYGDIINWEKDPMNKPQNQNKYFFSDGKTYYEQICKMLRLMSVFKEAFNQIYSNEDEISEAWENFVNNLSASVVEGSEPDVTLTWTDDSVNFEFTMVPGVPGDPGVGITSISFNSDYTMTITLSDETTYTSMSLKGDTGPQGPQGETGSGLQILDVYTTLADLQSAHPTGQPGDAYQVGSGGNYILYIWSSSQSAWVQAGTLGTVSPSTSAPLMDGTASAGSQNLYARGDHVHPSDTSRASKEELDALIKTSQALIDQSFTYRKSPAIQDGIAEIKSIKGNTIVENDSLVNFEGTGLKTVGFNLFDPTSETINAYLHEITSNNVRWSYEADSRSVAIRCFPNTTYCVYANGLIPSILRVCSIAEELPSGTGWDIQCEKQFVNSTTGMTIFTTGANAKYLIVQSNKATFENVKANLCISVSGDKNGTYEPYTENTTNLPVATYFPTGMKSAGSVYDELTPTKAITRIGAVDLGTLTWSYEGTNTSGLVRMSSTGIKNLIKKPSGGNVNANILCQLYATKTADQTYLKNVGIAINTGGTICIYDENYNTTDKTSAFKTSMSGVYLYYELATPVETTIDLGLDFRAYENGTEQLLPVNGSVPSTSPIIADMTYLSIDDAMEYIIDKLANVPENTQHILDSLEDDVADLQEDVGALQPAVSDLQTSVGNINTNIGQISSTVAGHTSSISNIQSDITDLNTGLSDLEDTVTDNTSRISTLETDLSTTDGQVQNLATSVSGLDSTVTAQGTTVTELDSIIQDISNNPAGGSIGNHELGFVVASVEATLPANTGTMVTIPKPTIFPNNYTPLFIVGMSTGSYNVSICSIPYTFGNANSVTCRVWNHGSQQTTQISVYILCMRQRQSQ